MTAKVRSHSPLFGFRQFSHSRVPLRRWRADTENAAQKIGVGRSKRLHDHCLSSPRILMVETDCGRFILPRDFRARCANAVRFPGKL